MGGLRCAKDCSGSMTSSGHQIEPHLPTNLTGPAAKTIGASSAASFTCFSAAHAGAIARPSMVPTRRSTIASIAGPSADIGRRSSKPGPLRQGQRDFVDRLHLDQGASLRQRRKRGEHEQAIGRSRGGRTTKIHALSDPDCRPCAFHLTPGQDADIAAAPALLALAPPMSALIADKGYDGDELSRRNRQPRRKARDPKQIQQNSSPPLQQARLQRAQCHRALLLPAQRFQAHRHPL